MMTPQAFLTRIEDLTYQNDHTGARILIAQYYKMTDMVEAYEAVEALNRFFGHVPVHLSQTRQNLDNILFDSIRREHGPAVVRTLRKAL
jgi:hypothetical protein